MNENIKKLLMYSAILIGLTIPFWIFKLDIIIQRLLYDETSAKWLFSENPIVLFLYNYGTYPGIALAIITILVFAMSFASKSFSKHRKASVVLIITFIALI